MAANTGYNSQRPPGNGPWFLHIENLPRKYTWQDLKDLIRKQASHGIWTEMAVHTRPQNIGIGSARVRRVDEATRLYKYLTENIIENRRLVVHLWDTTAVPAVFVRCNCPIGPQPHPPSGLIAQMSIDPGWHTFYMTSPPMSQSSPYQSSQLALSPTAAQMSMQPRAPQQYTDGQIIAAMARMQLDYRNGQHVAYFNQVCANSQRQQQAQAYLPQQQSPSYQPMYIPTSSGTPINISQGHVRVEARGVFVSGLNYKARTRDIEAFFREAGDLVKTDLHTEPQTGKSKGNATIHYSSAEAAARAVDIFHGKEFMKMRLNVRLDRDKVAVNAPQAGAGAERRTIEPVIVDGSQVRATAATRA